MEIGGTVSMFQLVRRVRLWSSVQMLLCTFDEVLCWLLSCPFSSVWFPYLSPDVFPFDLVWLRLSCNHGWIRSGSVMNR